MSELDILSDNTKANMFGTLMESCVLQAMGLLNEANEIENNWITQSNLIYLLNNPLATDAQHIKAANEIGRLNLDMKKQDKYTEITYWDENYSQ